MQALAAAVKKQSPDGSTFARADIHPADQGTAAIQPSKSNAYPAGFGICGICGNNVEFRLKQEGFSLRETVCPDCGGSRRSRDLASVLVESFGGPVGGALARHRDLLQDISIFEAQACGPLHEQLRRLPGYVCAEFLDGIAAGALNSTGMRCENLEALTFPDGSFDLVITQDVLEHVARPAAAFREIARVLKPGGFHIFTVPLHEGRSTVTRVIQDEEGITFTLLPVYHGDPLRSSGSLVYTDFGDDLPTLLLENGFTTELLRRGMFYTPEKIPSLTSDREHARYEHLRTRGEHLKLFLYNSVVLRSKRSDSSLMLNERIIPMEQHCHQAEGNTSPPSLNLIMEELLEVVRHEPVSAAGLVHIGESCFRYDLAASASGFFRAALERDPHCSDATNNLGVLAFAGGDYKNAESLFIETLESAPAFREARHNLAQLYREAPQLAARQQGDAVHCPCCGGHFAGFISGGPCLRPNACCPRCGSLERHRLLWLYLQEKTGFFTQQLRVLHVAPESIFQETFKRLPNLDYISADIASPLAMVKMDITDIHFPDNTFDVILCSHVLEHIPDDRLAMRELFRVLKPGGWAILQVPIDMARETTYEDPAITGPEERRIHFGQDDHVRWYGRDYEARLTAAGFAVSVRSFASEIPADSVASCGILTNEDIFHCAKPETGEHQVGETPLPPTRLRFMNETPEQFLAIGDALYRELREYAGLSATGKLLDIGSGYGRLAHAMIRSDDFQGVYTGIEILPIHSAWCRDNLTRLKPDFRFIHLDVLNDRYNPGGSILPSELVFPFTDHAYDVICLASVFTHMYEEDILRYLTEIRRMLAPDGSVYVTFFLLNDGSRELLAAGRSSISMTRQLNDHTLYHNADDPLHAIAFEENWLRGLIASTQLSVRSTLYGTWCGRKSTNLYQDTLILEHQPNITVE
jgi:SAM-dependent methyltransferase